MEEASLVIRFKDESSVGATGYSSTGPLPNPPSDLNYAQGIQGVYTSAGGVGAFVDKGQMWQQVVAIPQIPSIATSVEPSQESSFPYQLSRPGDDALIQSYLQKIAERESQVDVKIRTEARPLNDILDEMRRYEFPKAPYRDPYLRSLETDLNDEERIRQASKEYNDSLAQQAELDRQSRIQDHRDEMAARMRQQQELDEVLRAAKYDIPKPPPLTKEQIISESEKIAPPVQGEGDSEQGKIDSYGVQNALSRINNIAGNVSGPVGQAITSTISPAIPAASTATAEAAAALGLSSTAVGIGATVLGGVAAVGAIGAAGVAAGSYFQNQRVQDTMGYSPEVAIAVTESHIARMMRNIQTAQEYGPQIAASESQAMRVSDSWRDFNNWWGQFFVNWKDSWNNVLIAIREGPEAAREEWEKLRRAREEVIDNLRNAGTGVNIHEKIQGGFMDIIPQVPEVDWREYELQDFPDFIKPWITTESLGD